MNGRLFSHGILLLAVALLAACAAPVVQTPAPIVERSLRPAKPVAQADEPGGKRPAIRYLNTESYTVQKGDTLYSIAFSRGLDYREVAELNNLADPSLIQIGQQLMLPVASSAVPVESKPAAAAPASPPASGVRTQPRVARIPWSSTALKEAEEMQQDRPVAKPATVVAPPPPPVAVVVAPPPAPPAPVERQSEEDTLEWSMPARGSLLAGFSESANRKGIDIAGKQGQPVYAAAAGKVVYSGSGLRGYGRLVIIKHNSEYLSAYAHNDRILVKEGQNVARGQQIAEMGNSDSDQVKLHFEIRKFGKPVDPAQYLPLPKP